ncbi:MAG: glycosyl hydrolase [Flavobacterium sp.]
MQYNYQKCINRIVAVACILFAYTASAQFTNVGAGSYTTTFPGTDSAGRNAFPSGSPLLSGNAIGKPVPTNDWWSAKLKNNHVNNLFNYPMAMRTVNEGLVVSYIMPASTANGASQPMDDQLPITVGVNNLNAGSATVNDYSDWTVSMNWSSGANSFTATAGIAMPFVYFTKATADVARVKVVTGTVVIANEMLVITDSHQGADYAVYAPVGSTWTQTGNVYTSTLNGKNYWSMAYLPPSAASVAAAANEYKAYAYVFPTNTTTSWNYNSSSSKLTTTFTVATDVKEGTGTSVLLGLLPHQWAHLSSASAQPSLYNYTSIRGEIKTLASNTFIVENTFKGILPTLPYLDNYSNGFNPALLDSKIASIENDGLASWTDSYNEGQVMNRLIQTARIADEMGDTASRNKMVATIKERLEDWLKAEAGENAFIFYYNNTWSTLLGYPAGHGQDNNINDHHFHWGYFIHAAAFMEQYEPGWAAQWGPMVNLLIRDAASWDRNDTMFPFLRNFSPYAGHSWANGFATFPFGNDQESTSESMQFASSLIHWGQITENNAIRDLGIYIYTTEQTATEEYWFDMNQRTFKPGYGFKLASRIWGNGYDNQTFWTGDIAAAYGIEMYPIHGGSLYLGHNVTYAQSLWNEITTKTGILTNQANPNLWHDVYWQYLAFTDAQAAINLYDSYPNRSLKFGISDAQTYHWLHAMNALGRVNAGITSDYPIAAAFTSSAATTYVAHNYSDAPISVTFSDGFVLPVPANQMATSRDIDASGVLSADFYQAFPNGSVNLTATVTGTGITKVAFYNGSTLIGEDTEAPYQMPSGALSLGIHSMYAKVYVGTNFNTTNIINVTVGEQVPYSGTPFTIPGVIEAGNYDKFEGGIGQGISYFDSSPDNQGNYRTTEYVDAATDVAEGPTVGWIGAGEWMEYTINVVTAGNYTVTARYACGNTAGGGPFRFEIDGAAVSADIIMGYTGDWGNWADKVINNVQLAQGQHVLRVAVTNGEFNLGRMTFVQAGPLAFVPPVANAGENVIVVLPNTTATLNGSLSSHPTLPITYLWEQVYGPSVITFSSTTIASPGVSNLVAGVYKVKLTVSDGTYSATDEVLILVSASGNAAPAVSVTAPSNNASYLQGDAISMAASASDLDGTVASVAFYAGAVLLGTDTEAPFTFEWTNAGVGTHSITAVATDDDGATTTSTAVSVTVSQMMTCSETSTDAQQGAFTTGYKATFTTVGSNVTIQFEMLDTDKTGVVAYLWQQTPFGETQMDNVGGLKFAKTLSGQTAGTTLTYAVKFAYAGGLSVTKYISYVVGTDCAPPPADTQAPTNFTATLGTVTANSVQLLLNATDNSGNVTYTITYGSTIVTTTGASGLQTAYIISGLTPETVYSFSVSASDASGNNAANNAIVIPATTLAVPQSMICTGTGTVAQQGAFSTGYSYTFETIGTDVKVTFTMLDTDKTGVVAFLWRQTPFAETPMPNSTGLSFSTTLTGQTAGTNITYAVKFAYAGGLAVTDWITYEVGTSCTPPPADTQAPTDFTATLGTVTSGSVQLLLNAQDNSGNVTYTITYGTTTVTVQGTSGTQTAYVISGLIPETAYSFSVSASDASGNNAANNAIVIPATTSAVPASASCSGTGTTAQQGTFSTGYSYTFETIGTDVKVTFTMLDTDKDGVVAFLWRQTPFAETGMTNAGGLSFSTTLTNQTPGAMISYAAKFAYAGGLAVTDYISYEVGTSCTAGVGELQLENAVSLYPNPATSTVTLDAGSIDITKVEVYSLLGSKVLETKAAQLNVDSLQSGMYVVRIYSGDKSVTKKLIVN